MATKANQHPSPVKSSINCSWLIQKNPQFIAHTCCTRGAEATVAHNKHVYVLPLSIYMTSFSASVQMELIPHCSGDLTAWNDASRLNGDEQCGHRNCLEGDDVFCLHRYLPLTCHFAPDDIAQLSLKHISYSAWAECRDRRLSHASSGTCVSSFNDILMHAEWRVDANSNSWRLVQAWSFVHTWRQRGSTEEKMEISHMRFRSKCHLHRTNIHIYTCEYMSLFFAPAVLEAKCNLGRKLVTLISNGLKHLSHGGGVSNQSETDFTSN